MPAIIHSETSWPRWREPTSNITFAVPLRSAGNQMLHHPIKDAVIAAGVSAGSASASLWFVDTLPIVQWLAGVVAILSGLVAIALGVVKLRLWLKSRNS